MSVKSALASMSPSRVFSEPKDIRAVRYAVGSTLAMAIAMGFQWNLSFLVPVLSLSFLATPKTRPNFRTGTVFVSVIAVACLTGLFLGRYLIPYPLVFLPFAGLLLLRVFYAQQSGRSPLLTTWLLIALLLIPLVIMMSPQLANLIALGIVFDAAVTIALVMFVYWLFPEPEASRSAVAPATADKPRPTADERFQNAMLSTLVVWPVMVLFYMFQWTGSVLILIFVALLSQQPAFAKNWQAGKALIIGNVVGGVVAIAFYELLVTMPEFGFLLLLTLLTGLVFGARVFSGKPMAPLYGMAFSTVLLVIGSTTSSEGDAGSKVYSRVIQMMLAVLYVVAVFGLIERVRRRREG